MSWCPDTAKVSRDVSEITQKYKIKSFVLGQEEDVVLKLVRRSQEVVGGRAEIHSGHGSLRSIARGCRGEIARH